MAVALVLCLFQGPLQADDEAGPDRTWLLLGPDGQPLSAVVLSASRECHSRKLRVSGFQDKAAPRLRAPSQVLRAGPTFFGSRLKT